jgi:hypothetical protein
MLLGLLLYRTRTRYQKEGGMQPQAQDAKSQDTKSQDELDALVTEEVKQRNRPSGTHYVEPSPLGIEPVQQTGVDKATNPPRSVERPAQTAEVPLGTGAHGEPPGGGGRESQRKE